MISAEQWLPADGLTLEPNAMKAAKEQEKCLALTAGPGAGKTEMLAQRADFLFRTGTCRYPKRILAISFKADASTNLKERVKRRCGSELASRFDSYTFHAFAKRIIDRFRIVLTGDDALSENYSIGDRKITGTQITFKDLIPLAIKILETLNIARNVIRQTYSDIFLDEFQDCTDDQYKLIKLAFQGTSARLTAVGDTKQKIMGWAGALEGVFETFAQDFSAEPLNMYRNFRSKPRLLRLQNRIIQNLDPNSVMPEELLRGDEGEILLCEFENDVEEAKSIVERISEWISNEKIPLHEIAILVSKQAESYAAVIMNNLEEKNIPYRNEQQLQDISTEPITRLIIDYLLYFYGDREPQSWLRLQEQILPFIDDEELEFSKHHYLQDFIINQKKIIKKSESASGKFACWRQVISSFLEQLSIETITALSPDYESESRLREIVNSTITKIQELLEKESDLIKVLKSFLDDQAIRIMTIHKSKGLEFHSVIMLAVEEETFWGDKDAERCAFFVGVSRAKQRLLITNSKERQKPEGERRWSCHRNKHAEYWEYFI
ncbi:ATP-dependent helicase [uncultured Neisseria sp.]|uniref:UvrD-helicase domain-containing protein n=1 Tax=uncultured Neisseria sp. TaxID=237778 RepID=UPI0025E7416E|nr:ATP-dependent helicase [uncultured Neisseria sp.]